ncbi:hypothetical protein OAH97_00125 [Octadecabacter sp.]|nr:hypothetical protein [Octadecabacter sp.]
MKISGQPRCKIFATGKNFYSELCLLEAATGENTCFAFHVIADHILSHVSTVDTSVFKERRLLFGISFVMSNVNDNDGVFRSSFN